MIAADAIKIAYRQGKDGFVVSFAIHPSDMPADLANADIGSQWRITLTPLDADGNPESEVMPSHSPNNKKPAPVDPPARADKRLMKQAGICCRDPRFWQYLTEKAMPANDAEDAAVAVRLICHVKSRNEIVPDTPAGATWQRLYDEFALWRDVPEYSP